MTPAKRTMLVTGSRGMLATDLAEVAARRGYEVIGLSHGQLDITQADAVRETLTSLRPDVVVNTPGLAVDVCEESPERGYRTHTWAPMQMAGACQRLGATMVYVSTCGLFGDEVRAYSEYDAVVLKTHYARSKYLGEEAVRQACDRALIIRPGWLFGGSPSHRRNFVYQRYLEAKDKPVLRSAGDKFGSPTYTADVAERLIELLEAQRYGIYHVANEGGGSRYDYVKCIVEAFGLSTVVEKVDSSQFPRLAPVPDSEMLTSLNLRFAGIAPLEPWQEAIRRFVAQLKRLEGAGGSAGLLSRR